jgi:hypothetical protein
MSKIDSLHLFIPMFFLKLEEYISWQLYSTILISNEFFNIPKNVFSLNFNHCMYKSC